jgi:FkbM family methyltransferase
MERPTTGSNRRLRRLTWFMNFLRKPASEQRRLVLLRWLRQFPGIPLPLRVPNVGWWLARNDVFGQAMLTNSFETRERRFVDSILRPGMTVLDVGAHQGLYTLLASKRVGPQGRVVAFEPSPRERKYLRTHLRLNRCKNVQVESVALGRESGSGELFLVEGMESGCNSLRPPNVDEPTTKVAVEIRTLDESLARLAIQRVDFMKIDVEGAELDVFRGAKALFEHHPRPLILAEVQDMRTIPWGYRSNEIVLFLIQRGYRCLYLSDHPPFKPVPDDVGDLDDNLVAVPEEGNDLFTATM